MIKEADDLYRKVSIRLNRWIPARTRRILLALSGGPDSTVLAHLVNRWAQEQNREVVFAHYVHVWPETAEWERRWVIELARDFKRPLIVGYDPWLKRHHKDLARRVVSEAELRRRRFRFLLKAARAIRTRWILLAHHQQDQVETILQRLIRGTGPAGLTGMRPVKRIGRYRLVRPMLDIPVKKIRQYQARYGLHAFDDPSNRDVSKERNWLRHRVIPLIVQRHPQFVRRVSDLSRVLLDEDRYLEKQVHRVMREAQLEPPPGSEGLWWDLRVFLKSPAPIQRRWIRCAYRHFRPAYPLSFGHVERTRRFLRHRGPGHERVLPGGVRVIRDREMFGMRRQLKRYIFQSHRWEGEPEIVIPEIGVRIHMRQIDASRIDVSLKEAARQGVYYLDARAVTPPGVWRPRKPGDRFQPLGMKEAVRLKRFFTARKIPYDSRWRSLIFETEKGIALVWPWEIADWAKITPNSQTVWEVKFEFP